MRQASCGKGRGRGAAGSSSRADRPEETLGPTHALTGEHLALLPSYSHRHPLACSVQQLMIKCCCPHVHNAYLCCCRPCPALPCPALPQQHPVHAGEETLGRLLTYCKRCLGIELILYTCSTAIFLYSFSVHVPGEVSVDFQLTKRKLQQVL